jgi:fructose-1,6-bisphosphatase I
VVFDPLDGSSNIDVNVSVGTTFPSCGGPTAPGCERGHEMGASARQSKQIAAGYVVYGSSTVLVYSAGNGVHGFTLDPAMGAYVLSHENLRMPEQGKYYSVNEAYRDSFPPEYSRVPRPAAHRQAGAAATPRGTSARWWPTSTARCSKGASSFIRPPPTTPAGKLRLLYEANPIAFLAEQAGGMALATELVGPSWRSPRRPFISGRR